MVVSELVEKMPLRADEFPRTCRDCGGVGVASPLRERSSFYLAKNGHYSGGCKRCKHAYGAAARELERQRRAKDSEYDALIRQQQNEWARQKRARNPERSREIVKAARKRVQNDPERAQAARETKRAYRERIRSDPERQEAVRAASRMNHRLREERLWIESDGKLGKPLPAPGGKRHGYTRVMWPAGPFVARLEREIALAEREAEFPGGGVNAFARSMGIDEARIRTYRKQQWIGEDTVERFCAKLGTIHPGDLYPHAWERGPTIWGEGPGRCVIPEGWPGRNVSDKRKR